MMPVPTSLVDILQWRAKHQPDRLAYRYLEDGEFTETVCTYQALDQRARSIGARLQCTTKSGDRALLFFPPGIHFITAFFGCLYAKLIAVPAYPPHPARLEKTLPAVGRMAADADPAVVLLTGALFDAIQSKDVFRTSFGNSRFFVTDNTELSDWSDQWQAPVIDRHDLAFLQYTSGSTTTPRGVRISHHNLLHNLGRIAKTFGHSGSSQGVIWLPPYHDMGLIGGILQPLYAGFPVTLLSHLLFLQRPLRWLQAVSRFQATTSGAPDFAYDLCVRKIKPEQREALDLRSWQVAFNGAEPVQYKTIVQFAHYFAPCGFRQEAFFPCYGLAESTLLVTGGPRLRPIVKQCLSKAGLAENKVIPVAEEGAETKVLVSCGQNPTDQTIRIVDPETGMPCEPDEIGEIWIRSDSVAQGYWNNPAETENYFEVRSPITEEGPFLRTGDLGFLKNGELYLAGRLKNILISEGKNHYPQDLERTVESAHPAILPTGSAVFPSGEVPERIVVVAEIRHEQHVTSAEIIRAVRSALSDSHGLHVDEIRLTGVGGIPKTTSGKKKHFLCREHYLAGTLKEIH